jgi:UDP-N-acetylmuramoylalanine--D-glutamate ligase
LDWNFENLPGPHNLSNALAATLAAHCVGIDGGTIAQAFAHYRPMHHRLETVASLQGVRFVDDSKATNVSSVESALLTYQDPIVLIAGGRDKGLNLEQLGESIARHCYALVGIGEAGPRIVEFARERGLQRTGLALSMDEAVRLAHSLAPNPGVVLLSPACTSFDMFRNAEHRGDEFVASVHRWIDNSLEER